MSESFAPLIVITGPTASGKGSVAFELAMRLGGEIVSLDSMKVYREMDIGTAKPSRECREAVPYHLIDIVDPDRAFSTGDYLPRLEACLAEIRSRGRRPILAGGTALYLMGFLKGFSALPAADWSLRERLRAEGQREGSEALHERLRGVDARAAESIDPHDLRRIVRALEVHELTGQPMSAEWSWDSFDANQRGVRLFGIEWERSKLYERTDRRVSRMIASGLFEEADRLGRRVPPLARSARQCIGYKEIIEPGDLSREEVVALIQRNTRRLVKRQLTWFRKLPITWFPASETFDAPAVAAAIQSGGV